MRSFKSHVYEAILNFSFWSRATSLTVDAAAAVAASTVPVRCEVTQTTSEAEEEG